MDASGEVRRTTRSLPANTSVQINFIHEDAQGLLWFASETGLLRFDPRPKRLHQLHDPRRAARQRGPMHSPRPGRRPLAEHEQRHLPVQPARQDSFSNFHESDGLQGEQFNRKACFLDPAGLMYFGGLHGFNIFDPSRIPATPRQPSRVVLTEFRIQGSVVPVGPESGVNQARVGNGFPEPVAPGRRILARICRLELHRSGHDAVSFQAGRPGNRMGRGGQPEPLGPLHRPGAGKIPVSRAGFHGRQDVEQTGSLDWDLDRSAVVEDSGGAAPERSWPWRACCSALTSCG